MSALTRCPPCSGLARNLLKFQKIHLTLSVVVLEYKRLLLLTKTSLFIRLISLYYLYDSNFGQLEGKTYKLYICTLV